ncbi:uncharacterized protein AB675_6884 [Cyphellophora attinorum]|uniref:Uncharacterized protein n=1 Tax=Cyphellophora attinorum TaxID=1664694 RepID=A0A0N1P0T1_9EURO|nr:uncharacterized protein AB675_6884 [Phialophora attinorum]KPI43294.1 hypothetical protein AB675_6884 [Phialophora attinorum]
MSANQYYQQQGGYQQGGYQQGPPQGYPQYPQQSYGGPPQQGYYQGPPQGGMQYQQGPPQQVVVKQKKDRGCLGAWYDPGRAVDVQYDSTNTVI